MAFGTRHINPQEYQTKRLRVQIHGAVQGVGFRPFIYRLASELGLRGWVVNTGHGVTVEVDGPYDVLLAFRSRVEKEKPPLSVIYTIESSWLDPGGFRDFRIGESASDDEPRAFVLPDIATCPDCLREVFDPSDRRFLYPFTNCTNCGPRFSIIERLPYDRPHTSMKDFTMCARCKREYEDPTNRRFHAQPNACPECGPCLQLWDNRGNVIAQHHEAVRAAAEVIRRGSIVAMKGIGGFLLMTDARNDAAVTSLRRRKHREEKPFAVMFPSLEMVRAECVPEDLEAQILLSPQSPIVLLERNGSSRSSDAGIAPAVAPGNPYLGVMLAYSPLHHMLMRELGFPVTATSGNISDEPICIDEYEALERLHTIADVFLVHNRPIVRHIDDSVVRVMMGREQVLRRARGYAPLPVHVRRLQNAPPLLAVGAHLKNAIALTANENVFISQHIGDLETTEAYGAFTRVIRDFTVLYDRKPDTVVCDSHPDYLSTQFAHTFGDSVESVQHHYAHVCSCMAENDLEGEVLGVSWDGTGYGTDGTIWGGEFLVTDDAGFTRLAAFRPFSLPGGGKAIKEPRRAALGLLFSLLGEDVFLQDGLPTARSFRPAEKRVLRRMLTRGVHTPITSSVGRLYDAVASILGIRDVASFEGQAAMEMEFAVDRSTKFSPYPLHVVEIPVNGSPDSSRPRFSVDWGPMIRSILEETRDAGTRGRIAARFHHTLVEAILLVARKAGLERVVLTGGCFQNRYLTEQTVWVLGENGFRTYWHQRVPPNDGGIALGQIYAAARRRSSCENQTGDPEHRRATQVTTLLSHF